MGKEIHLCNLILPATCPSQVVADLLRITIICMGNRCNDEVKKCPYRIAAEIRELAEFVTVEKLKLATAVVKQAIKDCVTSVQEYHEAIDLLDKIEQRTMEIQDGG